MRLRRFVVWLDRHPRTAWYIAVVVTLDFLMHIVESIS